jgi:putative SOS response-associated peptidase YedK
MIRAMCGRYLLARSTEEVAKMFRVTDPFVNTRARYNIAPTQDVLAIIHEEPMKSRVFAILRWGLVPHWAKDSSGAAKLINARAETVASKPSFRDAYRKRRCVIPADGFYEWRRDAARTPFAIARKDRLTMPFAGLWERWTDKKSGETIRTCTILTTSANELCAPIHDRMPVILRADDIGLWLGEEPADADALAALLRPYPAEEMVAYAVDKRVGNVRNDDPSLIEPVASLL